MQRLVKKKTVKKKVKEEKQPIFLIEPRMQPLLGIGNPSFIQAEKQTAIVTNAPTKKNYVNRTTQQVIWSLSEPDFDKMTKSEGSVYGGSGSANQPYLASDVKEVIKELYTGNYKPTKPYTLDFIIERVSILRSMR